MSQTISKHIGEGFARGELYAALAYNTADQFGGMRVKSMYFIKTLVAAADRALHITTTCALTAGDVVSVEIDSTMTGSGGVGQVFKVTQTAASLTLGSYVNAIYGIQDFSTSGKVQGLAAPICAELKMPNINMSTHGAYFTLELEYVAGGNALVTAGALAGNHAGFMYLSNSGDDDGDFDDHGFLMHIAGLTSSSGHLFYANKSVPFDAYLKIGVGTATYYIGLLSQQAAAT